MDLPRLKIGFDKQKGMPVYVKDRFIHTLLMGKSGTGKSTSITNWWQQDHIYKNAKVLIDPAGFLGREAYSISGGIYCSLDYPCSINMMVAPYTDPQIINIIAESVNQMITLTTPNQPFTVKMRDILDTAVKYCLNHNRKSLLHVLDYIKNLSGDKETRDGIIARLQYLLSGDERMVKLLCGNDAVEWGEIIKNRKTFILDCWGMSREQMIFAGSLVTNGIKNYFRYARPKQYLPCSIFIDECHNFITPSLFDILKEGRKYKLSAVLSTQDFATIDESLARVMLNVGNIVSFRLAHREATYIAREIDIMPQNLQFIEKYHVAYLTPKERGIAKAPSPLFVIPREPKAQAEPQRKSKPSWFVLESCPKLEL